MKRWFWGILFVIAGAMFLVNSLELFWIHIDTLTLFFTITLSIIIILSIIYFNFVGIIVPLSIIGILFAEPLGITQITPWPILITAVLLSIGLETIFGNKTKGIIKFGLFSDDYKSEIVDEEDSEEVKYGIKLGSGIKYVNSKNLKKCYLNASLGELKVYFDNCKVSKEGAEIIINASLSEIELFIPKDWNVQLNVSGPLNDVAEKNQKQNTDGPVVTIKGNVSVSELEIFYI